MAQTHMRAVVSVLLLLLGLLLNAAKVDAQQQSTAAAAAPGAAAADGADAVAAAAAAASASNGGATGSGASTGAPPAGAAASVHTVFLTDCTAYSDWQSMAMVFAWRAAKQPGKLTRVMCCAPGEADAYAQTRGEVLGLVPTHVAPSFSRDDAAGDDYAAYNKPGGVMHWLEHGGVAEEWILVLDSDMLLRRPFDPADFNLTRGWAAGARYDYLIGVDNELAERHIPEAPRRADALAGPPGRRADRVGGFYLIHREDLRAVAPLWLQYARAVRRDPEAWRLAGDFYATKRGDRPWISEMYGYSFAAAKLGLRHRWDEESMIYPGYTPAGVPRVLHYGLLWHLDHEGGRWSFDKHWFQNFNPAACPPWDLSIARPQFGLLPAPPLPAQLRKNATRLEHYTDLISIEAVATINAALCARHVARCAASDDALAACRGAAAAYEATISAVRAADADMACTDMQPAECREWAKNGECQANPMYMNLHCKLSCNRCRPQTSTYVPGSNDLAEQLAKLPPAAAGAAAAAAAGAVTEPGGGTSVPNVAAALADAAAAAAAAASQAQQQQPAAAPEQPPHHDPIAELQREPDIELAPSPSPAAEAGGHTWKPQLSTYTQGRLAYKRELAERCYKHDGLTMQQVKDCLHAARQGREWDVHMGGSGGGSGSGEESAEDKAEAAAAAAAEEDDDDGDDRDEEEDGDEEEGEDEEGMDGASDRRAEEDDGGGAQGDGGGGDSSSSSSSSSSSDTSSSGGGQREHQPTSRIGMLGAALAWFGVVGAFLSILPRVYTRTRRRASGADALKLSV